MFTTTVSERASDKTNIDLHYLHTYQHYMYSYTEHTYVSVDSKQIIKIWNISAIFLQHFCLTRCVYLFVLAVITGKNIVALAHSTGNSGIKNDVHILHPLKLL